MKLKESPLHSAFFNLRALGALTLCLVSTALAVLALKPSLISTNAAPATEPEHYMPLAGESPQDESRDLNRMEQFWTDRLTYPTGKFNPAWVRAAAGQHKLMPAGVPKGSFARLQNPKKLSLGNRLMTPTYLQAGSPLSLSTSSVTSLGPSPLRMTGCAGCFDYGKTQARVNAIVVDPTTTVSGSITAYIGSVNGGVWKATNCCTTSTTWTALTDDPLIGTTAIDTLTIDPNDHNTIYAGTGDLNYGSFSMGSQGILKSTNGGNTWTVLGANVFGPNFSEPAGNYPQYNAVGKVRVDPNNSNNVAAGTKNGLYLSHDGGNSWTQCATNSFNTQRQDITGLELSNMGGGITRILAAVGVRGFPTFVQYDLGKNGANGLYSANMSNSGCPSFNSIASNANGFVFGTAVAGSPYTTGALMNAGSGVPCDYPYLVAGNQTYCGNGVAGGTTTNGGTVNNLGRMDIVVAPSNPNYIYAQVGSIDWNGNSGCGTTTGCQLGVWASADGGATWSFMNGSAGGALRNCAGGNTSGNPGDYPQNWYDQGMAVDPNNPDRVFIDTYDTWFATRTGSSLFNVTCGYNGSGLAAHVVHVDHHALAFLPGSSDTLLEGSDGGIFATTNASTTTSSVRPTWLNMDTTQNTIEFYSGDISANFANAAAPVASGGAQDNGSESVTFAGSPTGPVQWQMGVGGDGFTSRIDPVGTGTSLRIWQGGNSGGVMRCINNCTASGASWSTARGSWTGDTQSFVFPYDIFHGGIAGGDDCGPAGTTTGCSHLLGGTTRVWETILGAAATVPTSAWVQSTPNTCTGTNACVTKGNLGNRSYINQIKYSPKYQSVGILGTNDGNVQIGFSLGSGVANGGNWVNVTGSNAVLPNRPIQGICLDPSVGSASTPVGYAAVGGFNANSLPSSVPTPGHVFQVTCTATCGSFTWVDKTGNLPDIPANTVIVNPNYPQQVFLGTDFGLYFTNDITQASPLWYRYESGMPHVMVWDMQIDRGSTALSVWTRGRGAFVYPLPSTDISQTAPTLVSAVSRFTHGASGTFDLPLPLNGSGVEPRSDGSSNFTIVMTFDSPPVSANVSSSSGSVSNVTYSGNSAIVSLTGISDQQVVTVNANGVTGTNNAMQNASIALGFLFGDVNADRTVNVGDTVQVRNNSGATLDNTNFQNDINVDGMINVGDTIIDRNHSGDFLP
jgi:hypothetical protein